MAIGKPNQRVTALRGVPIFASLSTATLFELSRRAREESHPAGKMLILEGDCSHALSIVMSGSAALQQDGEAFGQIGVGGYFGELCMIDGSPSEADVIAIGDVVLLVVDGTDFDALLKIPDVARAVMVGMAVRIRELGVRPPKRRPIAPPSTCDIGTD